MEPEVFVKRAKAIRTLMDGTVEHDIREAIEELIEAGEYELLSHLMVVASEVSVRRTIDALISREIFPPLVAAAVLRREVRRAMPTGVSALGSKRIFRDFEAPDEGEAAIPEHIIEEAEAISEAADQARRIAAQRESRLDRDPVRQHIVDRLAGLMATNEGAMEAMIAIARASVWEDTARAAAMKLANNKVVIGRLSRSGRVDDLIGVGEGAASEAVRHMIARTLAEALPEPSHPSYRTALEYIAEHHPSEGHRRAALRALGR